MKQNTRNHFILGALALSLACLVGCTKETENTVVSPAPGVVKEESHTTTTVPNPAPGTTGSSTTTTTTTTGG